MNTPGLVGAAGYVEQGRKDIYLPDRLWQVLFAGVSSKWMHYWSKTQNYRDQIKSVAAGTSSSMQNISQLEYGSITVTVPPVSEQQTILNFLDRETAKIDALIEKQEQLIATLREDRAVTITQAVTKGLDPSCKLVKSTTGWIDSIPIHWEETKLKWNVSAVTSGSRGWAQHYSDDGDYFIRIGNLTRDSIGFDDSSVQRVTVPLHAEGSRTMTREGDLLFSITAYLGSVAVVDEHHVGAYVSQHVALARLTGSSLDPKYVGYAMLSEVGQRQLKEQAYGGTKVQLSLDDIRSIALLLPPKEEQASIVSFLDSRCAHIDALIAKSTAMIGVLGEYRSALITNAVTGRIDVREAV
ncbi:restriction endonuclease subunit S [Dietzia psychralcaliphila]|uniref:restriction endonuclease subunit S n=1 Tax=Dietzia psychralcaliphila TaxID=139021 RepID=UPI001C1DF9EE|nr:restriction endonuclease subunit S [Dietzia psychralcaliphila]